MRLGIRNITAALVSCAVLPVVSAAPIGYVATAQRQLGTVDLATGAYTPRGTTAEVFNGLGLWGGALYGVDTTGTLFTIDPSTAATTAVGSTDIGGSGPVAGSGPVSSFTSTPDGRLFAFDFSSNLYSVNSATGLATLIGPTGIPQVSGVRASIAAGADANWLYYLVEEVDDALQTVIPGSLYRVNPVTGASTLLTSDLPALPFTGGGYAGDAFYAFRSSLGVLPPGEIWKLDVTTGAVLSTVPQDPALGDVFGFVAAPIPEPASIALTALGFALLAFRGRAMR